MVRVESKKYVWELPHAHLWKDRHADLSVRGKPLLTPQTRIATIGSCFASELSGAMQRLGLNCGMHPGGLFYNSRSMLQELQHVFGESPYRHAEFWQTSEGFMHPCRDYNHPIPSLAEAQQAMQEEDERARQLFKHADLIVVTCGLAEIWVDEETGLTLRQIPPPEVLDRRNVTFRRLNTSEILADFQAIREVIRQHTSAEILVTVSPVPISATFLDQDVQIANLETKTRIRAALSEFVESQPDVHYFPSFDMVMSAEQRSDYMLEDGRHLHRDAIDYIINRFVRSYAGPGLKTPPLLDPSPWLSPVRKTAARIATPSLTLRQRVQRRLSALAPWNLQSALRKL